LIAVGDCRADVVGSLLRPPELLAARQDRLAGALTPAQYKRIEDAAVDSALRLQEECGLDVVTDGELRRTFFTAVITDALEGIGLTDGATTTWHADGSDTTETIRLPVAVTGKLRLRRSLGVEEFAYVRSRTSRVVKVTLPSPLMLAYFWAPDVSRAAYRHPFEMFADAAQIVLDEARELAALGCEYIQIDAPELATLVDSSQQAYFADLGIEPARMLTEGVDLIDGCAAVPGVRFVMHLCRGNNRGRWLASGGYESIAEAVFGRAANFDGFALEYDSPRAGSLEALRHVPDGRSVVLGLVSTKSAAVERAEAIEERVREAMRHVPADRLALSTQCGFASEDLGNPVTEAAQRAKLELVATVAHAVLG
jgi:5-methyltetrahydropteroyltriglutamate--homocysteine methyltransferase